MQYFLLFIIINFNTSVAIAGDEWAKSLSSIISRTTAVSSPLKDVEISESDLKKLKKNIKVTYDFDLISSCKKLNKVFLDQKFIKAKVDYDSSKCELETYYLMYKVNKVGGNTLYVNELKSDCYSNNSTTIAYRCNKNR